MKYRRVEADVPESEAEIAAALLLEACGGVEEPFAALPEESGGASGAPARRRLAGYLPLSENDAAVSLMSRLLEIPEARVRTSTVSEEDWANAWKAYYRPVSVGRRLLVLPAWMEPEAGLSEGRCIVRLDPGMAFGTGQHASTVLILEALEECLRRGDRVLDVGTGSGILAIAALKLGARRVEAIDVDPVAVRVAAENAARNGIDPLIEEPGAAAGAESAMASEDAEREGAGLLLRRGEIAATAAGSARLVLANITADVLLSIAGDLIRVLAERDADLLLSGLAESGEAAFRRRFEPAAETAGLFLSGRRLREGWACLHYRRA